MLVLEAPGESKERDRGYLYQVCISQLSVKSLSGHHKAKQHDTKLTLTDCERIELVKNLVESWAGPFRSFVKLAPNTTEVTHLSLDDFAPHGGLHSSGRTVLIGDAFHAMTMCTYLDSHPPLETLSAVVSFMGMLTSVHMQTEEKVPTMLLRTYWN